jgi:hypothetical protein
MNRCKQSDAFDFDNYGCAHQQIDPITFVLVVVT